MQSSDPASTGPLPPALTDKIRRALIQAFGDRGTWQIELERSIGRTGRRRMLVRAGNPLTGQDVAIKVHAARQRNRSEFRALSHLHRRSQASVAPFFLGRGNGFFAMEWIDAPLMKRRLEGPDRAAALTALGAWLADLHGSGPAPWSTWWRTPRLGLPLLDGTGPIGQATARLRARAARVPFDGPIAVLHGDFHAGNFFDLDGRPVAFDREHDRVGSICFDLAKLLTDIADRRERAALEGRPWSGDADADRHAFFAGYGAVPGVVVALLDLIEDIGVYRLWARALSRNKPPVLEAEMRQRGLIGTAGAATRPGRLVASATNPAGTWCTDPVPIPARAGLRGWLRARFG
ncbi:MAG: phosphotransferase family protein [Qingshengfaniella sp.]